MISRLRNAYTYLVLGPRHLVELLGDVLLQFCVALRRSVVVVRQLALVPVREGSRDEVAFPALL